MDKSKLQSIANDQVGRVKKHAGREEVRGNEQGTKQSLIGPLLSALGWDLSDPSQCVAEHRAKVGGARSKYPLDWALKIDGKTAILVEAKAAGKPLAAYSQQLAGYWTDVNEARFAILTNGEQWQFFTDEEQPNRMDEMPFATWDATKEESHDAPELLNMLQRIGFDLANVRGYAEKKRRDERTLKVLSAALSEPCDELVKVVIRGAFKPTRDGRPLGNLTTQIVDEWRPQVHLALETWANERAVAVLRRPASMVPPAAHAEQPKVNTTDAELRAFAIIASSLGSQYPVAHQDGATYFKVHVQGKPTQAIARIFADRNKPLIHLPLAEDVVRLHAGGRELTTTPGWTGMPLQSVEELSGLRALLVLAYENAIA